MAKKKSKKESHDAQAMPMMASEPVKKVEDGSEDDHDARYALEDIIRAEKHKANPALMKRVAKHAEHKSKQMRSIADLKHAYNEEAKKEA